MADIQKDKISGVEDTGHEWDGIRELNNPLPRWWLYVLYVCIIWSFIYWIFMPAWPMISSYTKGTLGYDQRAVVAEELVVANQARSQMVDKLLAANSDTIKSSPELQEFALSSGKVLFAENCAACHGSAASGKVGYPNLVDDDWLWDGTLEGIEQTLLYGIRSAHPDTRVNAMMAYGETSPGAEDGMLANADIAILAGWLAGDKSLTDQAMPLFTENCTACHGENGQGMGELGAPNLMDQIWLYGGDVATITTTISKGRGGIMPTWEGRLSAGEIRVLATYVHAQGGGQ